MRKTINPKRNRGHFRVAIFGSARIKKNDVHYKQIHDLSKKIAEENLDIVTGGGPGLMDAASCGHQEGKRNKNVHSYGLTIELPHEQEANKHLDLKKEFQDFSKRLNYFTRLSHVVVVAPGGIGTLLELFYTWQLIQVERIRSMPIILLGEMWPGLIQWVKKWPLRDQLLCKSDFNYLILAKNTEEVMAVIKKAYSEHEKMKKLKDTLI